MLREDSVSWVMNHLVLVDEALSRSVIGAFYEVYNTLRYGFVETVYVNALVQELGTRGHRVAREVTVRVMYKGQPIAIQRLDIVVGDRLVVEVKSTFDLHKASLRQLRSYLQATRYEVGLLLHFGPEARFHRLVCRHDEPDAGDRPDPADAVDPRETQ